MSPRWALVIVLLSLAASSGSAPSSSRPVLQRQPHCSAEQEASKTEWWPSLLSLRGGSAGVPCPPPASLIEPVKSWHPVLLAFLGTFFGWFMTALGSAAVIIQRLNLPETAYRKVLDFMLGVSGKVEVKHIFCDNTYASDFARGLETHSLYDEANIFVDELTDDGEVDEHELFEFIKEGKPFFVNDGKPREGSYEKEW